MSADVKPPFLGCDEGQAGCANPHAIGSAVSAGSSTGLPPALPVPGEPAAPEGFPAVGACVPSPGGASAPSDGGASALGRDGGTRFAQEDVDAGRVQPSPIARVRARPGQARWVGPVEPERPVMEILFLSLEGGRRYYSVRLNGQEIFVGTRPECDRFLELHQQKVSLEQAEARRVPRARPFPVKTFRAARA
jgi:hypothetical protein